MMTYKTYKQYMAKHRRKRSGKGKRKTSKRGSTHSLFKIAARDKGYKAAKRAKSKADARAKRAWRKAQAKAKRKLRKMKYC